MADTRIYLAERIPEGGGDAFFIDSLEKKAPKNSQLFLPTYPFSYNARCVGSMNEADLVMIPQPIYVDTASARSYLRPIVEAARAAHLPVVVWVGGDLSHGLNFPGIHMLRSSQYHSIQKPNDVIIPPYCEDLGSLSGVEAREMGSLGRKPVISFCGWADYVNRTHHVKSAIKNALVDVKKILRWDAGLEVFKKGIYFRRRALSVLSRSAYVQTKFIIRRSFSGNSKTISLSPLEARSEYIDTMINSDFVLCVKGDGNHSVRFFEALSLGRIPVLVDTDVCLPFEDEIDYDQCILRVSYRDIAHLPLRIAEYWKATTETEFTQRQKHAREVFETYLRYDSFLNKAFQKIIHDAH